MFAGVVIVASAQAMSVGVACSHTTGSVTVASTGLFSVSGGQYSLSGGSLVGAGTATFGSLLSISGSVALSVNLVRAALSARGCVWFGAPFGCR